MDSAKKSTTVSYRFQTVNDLISSYRVTYTPVNWRKKGKVSPVRPSQGPCGSCWAFAAVAAIESAQLMRYGSHRDLSEQQLVDCTYASSYNGC